MKQKKFFLAIILLTCIHLSGYSQSDTSHLLNIVSRLDSLTATHPIEKVYLHLDKPYYFPGDTLRFKVYITVTGQHKPSALSGILYTDLISPGAKLIKGIKMQIVGGTATGDFVITDTLAEGTYRIRAYTAWMRNNPDQYYFDRPINITSNLSGQVLVRTVYKNTTDVNGVQRHALLTYTDKYNRPYANREVTYTLKTGEKTSVIHMAKTDGKGTIDVLVPAYKPSSPDNGQLITHLKLYGSRSADKTVVIKEDSPTDIQFFPESGKQIVGLRSKIAFKAIGPDGLGRHVKGTVTDNENNDVAYFESQHLGMGVFAMTPQAGKTYKAKITDDDGGEIIANLPEVSASGFVLAVDNSDSLKLTLRVLANPALFTQKQNSTFYIVGQSGGKAYYTTFGKLDNPVFSVDILKSRFPTGITQFTLFSSTNEPLNERVVFIQNNDQLKLDIKTAKQVYASREKVSLNIAANNKDNKPITGNFSLSVINATRVSSNQSDESSILSYTLLTSELKGYIESPAYYFDSPSAHTRADLDILMLSQGYRRFDWKQIINGKYPLTTFAPEQAINIAGTITTQSGKPVVNGRVRIFAPKINALLDTVTDAQGRFSFNDLDMPDTTKMMIQARKANDGKNVNISLNLTDPPKIYPNSILNTAPENIFASVLGGDSTKLSEAIAAAIDNDPIKLSEVKIKASKPVKPTIYNDYGTTLQTEAVMSRLQGYNSLYDAMNRVPGVFRTAQGLKVGSRTLSVIVDGRVMDAGPGQEMLHDIDPADVASVVVTDGSKYTPAYIIVETIGGRGTDIVRLKSVNITGKKEKKVREVTNSANLNGPGKADQVIFGEKLEACGNLLDCLRFKMPFVSFVNGNFMARSHSMKTPSPMIVVIDGSQQPTDALMGIFGSDVESVEVLTSLAYVSIYGSTASGGAIIVTTKRGAGTDDSYKYKSVPGVIYYQFKGYYIAREFYSPKYDHPKANDSSPDKRSTIYWNPNINTDKAGKAAVEYYNADGKGLYRAVIEGIDNDGNLGHYIYWYKVQ